YVEDITIVGNGKNKFWGIKSRSGSPQANRFRRVYFKKLKEAVTVDFGTHNYNADLFRFESCKATSINGWVFGVKTEKNSQSVVHTFESCDFESITGDILHFKSGGTAEIFGGSWIVNDGGRVIHTENLDGSGIGNANKTFNFYGTKFEVQYKNDLTNQYHLFYNKSRAVINFLNCNFNQFGKKGFYGMLDLMGNVTFTNCLFNENFQINTNINDSADYRLNKPMIKFYNCQLKSQANELVIYDENISKGNRPIVKIENSFSHDKNQPVNVDLNNEYGNSYTTSNLKTYNFMNSRELLLGLPVLKETDDIEREVIFKLPVGATIKKIRLIRK